MNTVSKQDRYFNAIHDLQAYIKNKTFEIITFGEIKQYINSRSVYKFSSSEIAYIIRYSKFKYFRRKTNDGVSYIFVKQ